jgi:hypothetical protein
MVRDVIEREGYNGLKTLLERSEAAGVILLQEIRRTENVYHRNILSLVLSDCHVPGAAEAIADAIANGPADDQKGTLLHALNSLGATLPLPVALRLVENGSYEAHMELYELFEAEHIAYGPVSKPDVVSRLEMLTKGAAAAAIAEAARAIIEIIVSVS